MSPKYAAERAKDFFEPAVELTSAEERGGYVRGACAGNADLLARVQTLLRAHDENGGAFLPEKPGAEGIETVTSAPPTDGLGRRGTMAGRYKLLQASGEGGLRDGLQGGAEGASAPPRGAEAHQARYGHEGGHRARRGRASQIFLAGLPRDSASAPKGSNHRDMKPSNNLSTVNDGVAVPKVIDFGIAKATFGRLTDRTVFTAFEQFRLLEGWSQKDYAS